MDKLERKLKSLAEQVELWGLSKEDVVRFIKDLISLHKISFTDIYPALGENFSRLKSLLTEAQKHASAIELKQRKIYNSEETADRNNRKDTIRTKSTCQCDH